MSDLAARVRQALAFDVSKAHREICDLAATGGRERWHMSIPVRTDDSDMILQAPLDHITKRAALDAALCDAVVALDHEDSHWHHPTEERPVRDCKACEALTRIERALSGGVG